MPVADSLNLYFLFPVAVSLTLYCLFRIWIGNRQVVADWIPNRQPASTLSVSNLNREPATSCKLLIRWTYIVCFELPVADSLNLYCLFRIWIGNRQVVAGCRFVELVCFESATESATGKLPVESWIGNRQLVASCRFVEFILSVSNLNRQPATSCRLPIRWTCLYRIGNWIGNRQLVASCRFVELILYVSSSCRLPIRWTCLFRIGNWIANRQLVASCRFVELILSVSNLNRQPATSCRLPIRCTYIVFRIWIGNRQLSVAEACLYRTGNWIDNRQLVASCRFVELVLSVSNLNRQPGSSCRLPIRWTCLFRIGNWISNRQLNRQLATWARI